MNRITKELVAADEQARSGYVREHGTYLATGACRVAWYKVADSVWCVRSATQCNYSGPFTEWRKPEHARMVK